MIKKIIIIGNGGSSSIASHFSIDYNNIVKKQCLNFSDHSMLTCFSNDYGYENWVEKTIDFYADNGELIFSTL